MSRFYSQQTRVTYLAGIHSAMPADAKLITEERYIAVLATPVEGKTIGHDADGLPILIDLTIEQQTALARGWRDSEIMRVQWLRDRHLDEQITGVRSTLSAENFSELLIYVQALRDWPENTSFPNAVTRPTAPQWIAGVLE